MDNDSYDNEAEIECMNCDKLLCHTSKCFVVVLLHSFTCIVKDNASKRATSSVVKQRQTLLCINLTSFQ